MMATVWLAGSCGRQAWDGLVLVKGGAFRNAKSAFYGRGIRVPDFYIGRYEVTQQEWMAVMGTNPSANQGDRLPVEGVSWYDCIGYCNARSVREGLTPYYTIRKGAPDINNADSLDDVKWVVRVNEGSNGYRLPTEVEWEYAASGGQRSRSYAYPGADNVDDIAWYWKNAGDVYLTGIWSWQALVKNHNKPQPVGGKAPNELGLYDMGGNVREWCWDAQAGDSIGVVTGRIWKGGGWIGADFCCAPSFRAEHSASGKGPDQGFRICRSVR